MCSIRAKGTNVVLQLIHLYAFRKFSSMYATVVALSGRGDHSIINRVRVGFAALTVKMS